jgi:hypothetical protein
MFIFRRTRNGQSAGDKREAAAPDERPAWMVNGARAALLDSRENLEVVGESRYQDNLWRLVDGQTDPTERVRVEIIAVLVAEPDNPYDANAVGVWIDGLKVGHLSRNDARLYRPGLLALEEKHGTPIALSGVIAGGGMREDGIGRLGVFLEHIPEDFGVSGPQLHRLAEPNAQGRTSETLSTEYAEASYLSWTADLPADDIRAIPVLRRLLGDQADPLARHFIFEYLEARLYRSRNTFTSALDEYDQVCRQHDAEMDGICQACISKWGDIPVLTTYRQMAIREQKAKNFQQALWWAKRGIAVYGDKARYPDHSSTSGTELTRTGPRSQARRALTTKPDHNGTRCGPIPADASKAQLQVSDGNRQSGRILRSEGHPGLDHATP